MLKDLRWTFYFFPQLVIKWDTCHKAGGMAGNQDRRTWWAGTMDQPCGMSSPRRILTPILGPQCMMGWYTLATPDSVINQFSVNQFPRKLWRSAEYLGEGGWDLTSLWGTDGTGVNYKPHKVTAPCLAPSTHSGSRWLVQKRGNEGSNLNRESSSLFRNL